MEIQECRKKRVPGQVRQPREIKLKLPKIKQPDPPKLCDLCGDIFKNQEKLSMHKRKVHFKNPVKCPKCHKLCVSDYYLKRHIKRKHDTEKNFICSACGGRFAFKGELTSHTRNVHEKHIRPKKTFACKFCDKTYKCAKSILIHERSVHTGKIYSYYFQPMSTFFSLQTTYNMCARKSIPSINVILFIVIKYILKSVTNTIKLLQFSGQRPAECTVCGSSFYHEDYLKEHMRLHTGETPFKCPICGRGYAQRGNMKSHLRIHRLAEIDAITLSKIKPNYLKLLKDFR